jgi:hypothetical protein
MKWRLAGVVLGFAATAHAGKAPAPFTALFDKGHTWKLEATQVDTEGKRTKGSLACEVTDVVTVGATQLSRIKCQQHIGSEDSDWGSAFPAGIYTLDKAGLGHAGSIGWDDQELAERMKSAVPGTSIAATKPVAYKHVTHELAASQRTTNVVTLRAVGTGWCYTEAGDFDGNEFTLCFDKTGLVGGRFQRVGADGHYDFGKVPAAYKVR